MLESPCVCAGKDPFADGMCKPYGVLSVMLDIADVVGGVWKFRTTSYNTVRGILSSLALIQRVAGGPLAGIPLDLVVNPKAVANPKDGKQQTIHIVHLEYRGGVAELQEEGLRLAAQNAHRVAQIERLEQQARARLSAPDAELDDEDTVPEFFPAEAARDAGVGYADPDDAPDPHQREPEPLPEYPQEAFDVHFPKWEAAILSRITTPANKIAQISTRYTLTKAQIDKINGIGQGGANASAE